MSSRRHVHTRSIRVDAWVRDDGLWDFEAVLVDTKSRDFPLATGVRPAGAPVHDMSLRVTIDAKLNILEAAARTVAAPYPGYCDDFGDAYRALVGLNLIKGFRGALRERLGGVRGCTHLTELAAVLPTAAVQAFAAEVYHPRDAAHESAEDAAHASKPFQLDHCHALRTDGPAVALYYPRWFRPPAPASAADADESSPHN
jgi:hypothetical protein